MYMMDLRTLLLAALLTTIVRVSATCNVASTTCVSAAATTNQLVLGTTKTTTLTAPAPAASTTITIRDPGASTATLVDTGPSAQTLTTSSLTINANDPALALKNSASTGSAGLYLYPSSSTGTELYVAASSNGYMEFYNGYSGGLFYFTAGNHIAAVDGGSSPGLRLYDAGGTNYAKTTVQTLGASRTYTVPDAGANANYVLSTGNTTFTKTTGAAYLFLDAKNGRVSIGGAPSGLGLDVAGGVRITSVGLQLPTAGATPTALLYYEEYAHTADSTGTSACALTVVLQIIKTNSKVEMYAPDSIVTCTLGMGVNAAMTFTEALPSRFRPSSSIGLQPCACYGTADGEVPCGCTVSSAGVITLYASMSQTGFSTYLAQVGFAPAGLIAAWRI